jgi:phosphoglycerate dehydrogenase-like enzyme
MIAPFRLGLTPDFYVEAKGKFEDVLEEHMRGSPHIEYGSMPPLVDKTGTPEALDQFDAIFALVLKITPESLQGVERLAVVARWGVGYDTIDVDALTAHDIALAITPQAVKRPVAEAILTFLFALLKNLPEQDRLARGGGWRGGLGHLGRCIPGHVLGSVGCGNIAREMFRLARPLGFRRLLAADPNVGAQEVRDLGVEIVDLDTVMAESDFVAVNTLLNASTRGLIGAREIGLMKASAYLINTARGPVVQHEALVNALRERKIAGAGIDVYPVEPPPKDDPLFALDNVIVTPHALAWTEEIMRDNGIEACQNILAVARGEVPPGIVNRAVLERPGFQSKLARYRSRTAAI